VVAKFLEKQAALAAAANNSSSSSSSHTPGAQSRDPAHSSMAQCRTNGSLETGLAAGSDVTEVQPPAAGGAAAVEGAGASAVERQAAAHPVECADTAARPTAASAASPVHPQVAAAVVQEAEPRATSETQRLHAVLSLRGRRCLDLSAGCGVVGE
jgi:hypothetical protein